MGGNWPISKLYIYINFHFFRNYLRQLRNCCSKGYTTDLVGFTFKFQDLGLMTTASLLVSLVNTNLPTAQNMTWLLVPMTNRKQEFLGLNKVLVAESQEILFIFPQLFLIKAKITIMITKKWLIICSGSGPSFTMDFLMTMFCQAMWQVARDKTRFVLDLLLYPSSTPGQFYFYLHSMAFC